VKSISFEFLSLFKVHEAVKDFILPNWKLTKISSLFREEMELGLSANPSRTSLFYMANTLVTQFPDGSESGDYLAIDLGGTNLRVIWLKLTPDGSKPQVTTKSYPIDSSVRQNNAQELFDYLAVSVADMITSHQELKQLIEKNKRLKLGFTFSFGYDQIALDIGLVKQFSFVTDLPDAIGKDAVQMLRDAFKRKSINYIDVVAIMNDSTSALVYGKYLDQKAAISLLLSTGYNIAYLEQIDHVEKLKEKRNELFKPNETHVVINTESCLFGDDGNLDFAKTKYDHEADAECGFGGSHCCQNLVGGYFIGELVRKCLLAIVESGAMFNGKATDQLRTIDSINAPDVSKIEGEDDGITLEVESLLKRLGYSESEMTSDDYLIVRHVCARVSIRCAIIVATVASVVVERIDGPLVKIACDGSLYKYHPKLHKLMTGYMNELVKMSEKNSNKRVEFFPALGGSANGAGLVAAVVDRI
jgi:hexokinase